jgi:hypothetical protein
MIEIELKKLLDKAADEVSPQEVIALQIEVANLHDDIEALRAKLECAREVFDFIAGGCLVPPDGGQPSLGDAIGAAGKALREIWPEYHRRSPQFQPMPDTTLMRKCADAAVAYYLRQGTGSKRDQEIGDAFHDAVMVYKAQSEKDPHLFHTHHCEPPACEPNCGFRRAREETEEDDKDG